MAIEYNQHHVIPICMKWPDHESNIERITSKNHDLIHKTLNIPHNHLREFRRRTNERTLWNGERSGTYQKLWKLYFNNIDMLPEDMLQIHNRSFSKQIGRGYKHIESLSKWAGIENSANKDPELLQYHDSPKKHTDLVENVERKLHNLMKVDRYKNDLFIEYYLKHSPNLSVNR